MQHSEDSRSLAGVYKSLRGNHTVVVDEEGNASVIGSRGKPLTQRVTPDGYFRVKVKWTPDKDFQWITTHRVIMEAVYGIPEGKGMQVNHKDLNKENNNINNLEWVTQKANLHHAMYNGVHNLGIVPVIKYDPLTGFGKYYPSQTSVSLDGHIQSNVSQCLRGNRENHHGYKWYTVEV